MPCFKENDMTHTFSTMLAAFAALALTFGSIGAIVTVPAAQAAAPATLAMIILA
jgi:hypothetical protein